MTEHEKEKDLLASRFVERALSYSWVKFGWETASKSYDVFKNSNRLAKFGCELAEDNVSKVVQSPLVEGTVSFLAPLIVIADEFGVRQLDKAERGVGVGQKVFKKVVSPVTYTLDVVASLPSRLLDRAEDMIDYYLPEEKTEGPSEEKLARKKREGLRASSAYRLVELALRTTQRTYSRMGYENLKAQATEKLHSYETLNDFIIYMKTNDPDKKEKLVKQGRDIYWNLRTNYRAIFIQAARSVVQPYAVLPTLRVYNYLSQLCDRTLKRVFLRGPFSPELRGSRPHT